jgi:hypothetical protein
MQKNLFFDKPTVILLIKVLMPTLDITRILSLGCGLQVATHHSWEDHVRDMMQIEDQDHHFIPQVTGPLLHTSGNRTIISYLR